MSRVEAPNEAFAGDVAGVTFTDGVGETDDPVALGYFRRKGYTVDGERTVDPYIAGAQEETDPRGVGFFGHVGGTWSKDAAVDTDPAGPVSDAFMPPTNVGENPHGPLVVSPGLHAVPPAPILPGPVASDPGLQQEVETDVARRVLVDGEPADIVATTEGPGGPLGLSDPSSVDEGPDASQATGTTDIAGSGDTARPAKSATKPEWVAWVSRNHDVSAIDADAMTKAELIDKYGG